jgi:hypothetical protein
LAPTESETKHFPYFSFDGRHLLGHNYPNSYRLLDEGIFMITVKQLERAWAGQNHERLYRDLIASRPESQIPIDFEGGWIAPAAAMAVIRLDELSQSHTPLYQRLLQCLLAEQQADGGWGDLAATALCVRALLCGQGQGTAIERGIEFLARLQKPQGLWPRFPLRRMPEDPFVSAFILYQLGHHEGFRAAIRMDDLAAWFELNEPFLNVPVRDLWNRAARRYRLPARTNMLVSSWS